MRNSNNLCIYCNYLFKYFTKNIIFCELVVVGLDLYMIHLRNNKKICLSVFKDGIVIDKFKMLKENKKKKFKF